MGGACPQSFELKTIIAKNFNDPTINDEIFPDTPSDWYHTSSTSGRDCWYVHFGDGRSLKTICGGSFAVRLVRSGQ